MDKTEKIQRTIRIIAGTLVVTGSILAATLSKWWLAIPIFVGSNLFQYGFTNWCLMEKILNKIYKQ